jgi:homopolymeric O-antigen transport system permease protein
MSAYYSSAQQHRLSRVLPDLIRSRQLLLDLVWKDLRARYRNAMMGFFWAVLQPLLMMLILTFVFSFVFRVRADAAGFQLSHHYAVLVLCGIVAWQFFATALTIATQSLVENQNLVQKVYFPREVIPIAAVLNCLVNFFIGMVTVLIVHAIVGCDHASGGGVGLLLVPVVFAIHLPLTIGLALLLSCLHVYWRDVGYFTEVALMFGFYASPVLYPLSSISGGALGGPDWLAPVYQLNPMAGLIAAYRETLLSGRVPDLSLLAWPALCAVVFLILGFVVFRRNAPTLADEL